MFVDSSTQGRTHIAALTGGEKVPSARFRVRQLIPYFRAIGRELREFPCLVGRYPPRSAVARPLWFAAAVAERSAAALIARRVSTEPVILQRPLISSIRSVEWLLKDFIFDVDDAIWLQFGGASDAIARRAKAVVCGNECIRDHYSRINERCAVIPTCVDLKRWTPRPASDGRGFNIGWSGTAGGLKYLYAIEQELAGVLADLPEARLTVSSNAPPQFAHIAPEKVNYIPWTETNEVAVIQSFDVGVMPLSDSPWERGKCSYKLLLYSAAGIPAVGSSVGMNDALASQGGCLTVKQPGGWSEVLRALAADPGLRRRIGAQGRACIEARYSCEFAALAWRDLLESIAPTRQSRSGPLC